MIKYELFGTLTVKVLLCCGECSPKPKRVLFVLSVRGSVSTQYTGYIRQKNDIGSIKISYMYNLKKRKELYTFT